MDHASVSALEAFVQQFMQKEKVPGLSIGISRDGETIYQKGFGVTDLGTNQPVTPETIFGIASVTKSFTAAAIMQLVAEGKLSVDDPIRNYLPDLQGKGDIHTDKITIHHLLSHTSGVPPLLRREELTKLPEHIAYLNEVQFDPLGLPLTHKEDEAPLYTPTREELEKLVGTYTSREGGRLRLFLREDAPVAEVAGMEYALRASSHDTLIDVQNGQPLRFFFKKQQQAWAVLMGLRMLCRSEAKF
ncbi:beta-lactamase family protein [Brevibacillus sp. RS1.1]|uniref:serine hydrolase domain-containing protein n=1 Tax=Brevibacillus sp. RS1.1 TaxID=2738982 RepID=UPI00156B00A3|nr:serine hydrolase domain-containing protein [Brevibacillus sp. RS1.1]NRR02204.1 beta-lactamase family protein [Brevibacillus sp. RS1.1]